MTRYVRRKRLEGPHPAYTKIAIERFVFFGTVAGSLIVLVTGVNLSCFRGVDPHWMNRTGAAVVLFQVVSAAAEFVRRKRLDSLRHSGLQEMLARSVHDSATNTLEVQIAAAMEVEIGRAERNAIFVVLGLAALGEFIHGFGDLLIEHVCR